MLGKLIKQELKVTSRLFIPMYLCFVVATLLLKLSFLFSDRHSVFNMGSTDGGLLSFLQGLMFFIYIVLLIGISILTYFIILKRFYSNMFGDEGYLMFTLPVTARQLLNSKLISSLLWLLIMMPMNLGSFFFLFLGTDIYHTVSYYLSLFMEEVGILQASGFQIGLILFEIILISILELIASVLLCYLAMTLGQHFFSEHRLLGSVGFYLLISTIQSAVESFTGLLTGNLESLIEQYMMVENPYALLDAISRILPVSLLCSLIIIVIYYLITHFLLNKKLNLN